MTPSLTQKISYWMYWHGYVLPKLCLEYKDIIYFQIQTFIYLTVYMSMVDLYLNKRNSITPLCETHKTLRGLFRRLQSGFGWLRPVMGETQLSPQRLRQRMFNVTWLGKATLITSLQRMRTEGPVWVMTDKN